MRFCQFVLPALAMLGLANATLLDVPNARLKVSRDWSQALDLTWQGIKERNIYPATGLIHRPKSETPNDAVSEGQGYGSTVALFAGDQTAFNSIWAASEKYMWNGNSLNWRVGATGNLMGSGAATDADQDVAAMLILADSLVGAGIWDSYNLPNGGPNYATRAQSMLNRIWGSMVDKNNGYHLKPGDGWGGYGTLNPGYYTPAFYRIFKAFDSDGSHNWNGLIDQAYLTLEAADKNDLGLTPDWCDGAGNVLPSGPGYNAFDQGHSMYKDAIRTLWRIGTDAVWYNEPRAKTFLQKSMAFLKTKGGASGANFYQMNGTLVDASAQFVFNGGQISRPRQEYSHLTIGMWAAGAVGAGDTSMMKQLSTAMESFYTPGAKYFGRATDANQEDTLHNEMYFDQFLAWWGVSLLAGAYSDITYDIANPPPPPQALLSSRHGNASLQVRQDGQKLIVRTSLLKQPGARIQVRDIQGNMLNPEALPAGSRIAIVEVRAGSNRAVKTIRIE